MPLFLSEIYKKIKQPSQQDELEDLLLFIRKRLYDSISEIIDFNKSEITSYEVYQLELSSISDFCVAFSAIGFGFPYDLINKFLKRAYRGGAYKYLSTNISEGQYMDYRNKKFHKYHKLNNNEKLNAHIAHPFICDFIEANTEKNIYDQSVTDVLSIDGLLAQLIFDYPVHLSNYGIRLLQYRPEFFVARREEGGATDILRWNKYVQSL